MTTPVRLQLSRRKGFNLQALSLAINGLPAINCARPGKWGNPYVASEAMPATYVVELYREWLEAAYEKSPPTREVVEELRGKNLACWCPPGSPCHATVLLELANR